MAHLDEDTVGPWSELKLNLLSKYLAAYTRIMARQLWCRNGYHHIDAFAGTGHARARDDQRSIDGSPRVALKVEHSFHSYTFIEMDSRRAQRLKELQKEFPDRRITIIHGDCNQVLIEQIIPIYCIDRTRRGHVFVDSFSMNLYWETVEAIASTGTLEVLVNVPTMALNRVGLPNDAAKLTDSVIARNDRFWGTHESRERLYVTVPTLFGLREVKLCATGAECLAEYYGTRLHSVFSHVTEPPIVTNTRSVPIHCFIFRGV